MVANFEEGLDLLDENTEMFDTYEKRDRMSQYRKMNINTKITES